jgi:phage baseplate assembly protein W
MRGQDESFIGAGWAFPATISAAGGIQLASGAAELDAAIRLILSTTPGERVMRPDFGCAMWELVFAPLTEATLGLIEQHVRDAIEMWEPRVLVDRVYATADQRSAVAMIEIDYSVRATNDTRNLVYPFYVIPRGDQAP